VLKLRPEWVEFPYVLQLTGQAESMTKLSTSAPAMNASAAATLASGITRPRSAGNAQLTLRLLNHSRWPGGPTIDLLRGKLPSVNSSAPALPPAVRFRTICTFHNRRTFRYREDPCGPRFGPLSANRHMCLYHTAGLDPVARRVLLERYQLWHNATPETLCAATGGALRR
jgi:hypothetical protein